MSNLIKELSDKAIMALLALVDHGTTQEAKAFEGEKIRWPETITGQICNSAFKSAGHGVAPFLRVLSKHSPECLPEVLTIWEEWKHEIRETGPLKALYSFKETNDRVQTHASLVEAMVELESGDPGKGKMALERLSRVKTSTFRNENPIEASIMVPGDGEEVVWGPDRDKMPATNTAFDTWSKIGPGEIGVILAPPSVGKTCGLVDIGSGYLQEPWIKGGGVVIHFSAEISADKVMLKYARRLTYNGRLNMQAVKDLLKKKGKKSLLGTNNSSLVIEGLSSGVATVHFLKDRITEILGRVKAEHVKANPRSKQEFKPLAIIVDYLQLMDDPSKESRYDKINECVVGLRRLAQEFRCPMWTASQPQRNPTKDIRNSTVFSRNGMMDSLPVLGIADVAECWAIPHVADYVVSINQTREEREHVPPKVRLHGAKIREPVSTAPDSLTRACEVDYATCTIA